ncbi:MAG: hypothetical protein ACODAU_11585 [Myxococcota bacterium]
MNFLERLRSPERFITLELRPPRRDKGADATMNSWFDVNTAMRRLRSLDTATFWTDSAVGVAEEENLQHLITNLAEDVPRDRICPFLTTKHPLEYCLWYAARAVESGFPALTVLGGDKHVGPPRCVPHGYVLRQHIRERYPQLALGGWANPHRDAERQVNLLAADEFTGEFYLTQVVSHHDLPAVEAFVKEAERRVPHLPGVFGVFYWRSANPKTLERLSEFMPVDVKGILADFESGLSADEICAKTIRSLFDVGVRRVYVSNLRTREAADRLEAIRALID